MKICVKCQRSFSSEPTLKMHLTRVHPVSDSLTLDFMHLDQLGRAGVARQVLDQEDVTLSELNKITVSIWQGDDPELMERARQAMTYIYGTEYRYVIAEQP